jgi:hypothetical protein
MTPAAIAALFSRLAAALRALLAARAEPDTSGLHYWMGLL